MEEEVGNSVALPSLAEVGAWAVDAARMGQPQGVADAAEVAAVMLAGFGALLEELRDRSPHGERRARADVAARLTKGLVRSLSTLGRCYADAKGGAW